MSEKNTGNYDPAEKVERMNRIFDHVVLPIIIFTVVMFVVSAVIFRHDSCVKVPDSTQSVPNSTAEPDAYVLREVLLEDMESNRSIFERGGYVTVETDESGWVAYCRLDDSTEVFDGISDGSGVCSVVSHVREDLSVKIRIYSENIFLVDVKCGEKSASAVFLDDTFGAWTSGSDAGAAKVLELISAQELTALTDAYENKILSLLYAE